MRRAARRLDVGGGLVEGQGEPTDLLAEGSRGGGVVGVSLREGLVPHQQARQHQQEVGAVAVVAEVRQLDGHGVEYTQLRLRSSRRDQYAAGPGRGEIEGHHADVESVVQDPEPTIAFPELRLDGIRGFEHGAARGKTQPRCDPQDAGTELVLGLGGRPEDVGVLRTILRVSVGVFQCGLGLADGRHPVEANAAVGARPGMEGLEDVPACSIRAR